MCCGEADQSSAQEAVGAPLRRSAPLDLMERSFARESDALLWCNVMSEAEPQATGLWYVAMSRGGRSMSITRNSELFESAADRVAGTPEGQDGVLANAELPNSAIRHPIQLESVGSF